MLLSSTVIPGKGKRVLADDLAQACGVRIVDGCHLRVVAPEQGAVGRLLGSNSLIVLVHREQLGSQALVHWHTSKT